MKNLLLSERAARSVVSAALPTTYSSIQEEPEIAPYCPPNPDVRLARLQSAWTLNAAGLWTATACFLVGETYAADLSFVFDVCAPLAKSQPPGRPRSQRFYVVWRGRWESLQTLPDIPQYESGEGVAVYANDRGGYTIENVGIRAAKIPSESYSDVGTLYFDRGTFEWRSSTLDIVGKNELRVKTKRVSVVTDAAVDESGRLTLTKETINVVG